MKSKKWNPHYKWIKKKRNATKFLRKKEVIQRKKTLNANSSCAKSFQNRLSLLLTITAITKFSTILCSLLNSITWLKIVLQVKIFYQTDLFSHRELLKWDIRSLKIFHFHKNCRILLFSSHYNAQQAKNSKWSSNKIFSMLQAS